MHLLVVEHVVEPRVGQDQGGIDSAEQINRLAVGRLVEHNVDITLLEAVVARTDGRSGGSGFTATDGGDFFRGEFRAAAVAWRRGSDVYVITVLLAEPDQRPGAKDLRVVGVGQESQRN